MKGPGPRLVAVAFLWVAVDALLLRIASGGNLQDWAYMFRIEPPVFVAATAVSVANLVVVFAMLRRPTQRLLRAAEVWAVLLAILGVALVVAHHDSASLIVVGALVSSWLLLGSASTLAERS